MLSHFRKRADECALRVENTKSENLRRDYQRLLDAWKDLIRAEEARLAKLNRISGSQVQSA